MQGISTERLSAEGFPLKEPRIIGNRMAKFDQRNSPDFGKEFYSGTQVPNVLSLAYGQELAHDMGLLVKSKMGGNFIQVQLDSTGNVNHN